MRAPIIIAIGFGIIACGGAAEEAARRESEGVPETTSPNAPAPTETPTKAEAPPRVETLIDSNAVPTPAKNISCKETILEASCATSHEHLAKALDLCFETKGDLGGYLAEERCTDKPGYKKARVTCCYGAVASKKAGALPVVAPVTTEGGVSGSSSGSSCPGTKLEGSAYAVDRAAMCAKYGFELVSLSASDRCSDGTVRTVGESCGALVTPASP